MPHPTSGEPSAPVPAPTAPPAASPSAALRCLTPTLTDAERRRLAQGAAAVVGVDAGKYAHTLVVRPRGGDDSKPFTFPSTREGFDRAVAFVTRAAGGAPPGELLVGIEFAGTCGFTLAHHLDRLGYPVVTVLAAHTRRWREVVHRAPLKTDAKDAANIADLLAQGRFVGFPFLDPRYAELRHLVSALSRVTRRRTAEVIRLRDVLQLVFPEFEALFSSFTNTKTPLAVLSAYPGAAALAAAPRDALLALLKKASKGRHAEATCDALQAAAARTVGLPGAQGALAGEVAHVVERLLLLQRHRAELEATLAEALAGVEAAGALATIPFMGPITVGVFLGSLGDPRTYASARQVLALAGLALVERSSGTFQSRHRISKRGRALLRHYLYIAALRHVGKAGLYRAPYEAMLKRNGGRRRAALIAVARHLLRLMYAVARDGAPFDRARLVAAPTGTPTAAPWTAAPRPAEARA
jgi:transposase